MPRNSRKPKTGAADAAHLTKSSVQASPALQAASSKSTQSTPAPNSPTGKKQNRGAKHLASIILTLREQQVLTWVAQGKSSWEIGRIIMCKECTVNFHCRNIMGKLNVSTRAHALIKAMGLGLINP